MIARLSSQQGLEHVDEILSAADAILLDRAGIEIAVGNEKLFLVEKIVTAKCIKVSSWLILRKVVCSIFIRFSWENQS